MREKIIISNIDLDILKELKEEKTINQIRNKFCYSGSQVSIHINRLVEQKLVTTRKYGTFKLLLINKKGDSLLGILI